MKIDGISRRPNYSILIFQVEPFPGGHEYELHLPLAQIDPELLKDAEFATMKCPDEDTARSWFFWLSHIKSRLCVPEDGPTSETFVLNNIDELIVGSDTIIVRGCCSPFMKKVRDLAVMRFRLRTLIWVIALLPPVIAGVVALVQLEWYRQHPGSLPTGIDPVIHAEIDRAMRYDPGKDPQSDQYIP